MCLKIELNLTLLPIYEGKVFDRDVSYVLISLHPAKDIRKYMYLLKLENITGIADLNSPISEEL